MVRGEIPDGFEEVLDDVWVVLVGSGEVLVGFAWFWGGCR